MTYLSGFTSHQPRHANFKRIHRDSGETKPCLIENNTETVNNGFFISSQYGLNTFIYTIILIKTSQKSKTRVGYVTFHNNDIAALWDRYKVFRLIKNNFLGNFSFISNWKWNFSSFFYGKQTFLEPKLIFSTWARVSENWLSAADYRKCSSLGSELTTLIDGILSKLLFQWVKKRFNLH